MEDIVAADDMKALNQNGLSNTTDVLVGWHRGHTLKSSTYEMFWAFLVLWSMLIRELHDATREVLSNFLEPF